MNCGQDEMSSTAKEDLPSLDEKQLIEVCRELRVDEWQHEDLAIKRFSEGTTNVLLCCWPSVKYILPDSYEAQCNVGSVNGEHCNVLGGDMCRLVKPQVSAGSELTPSSQKMSSAGDKQLAAPLIARFHGNNTSKFIDRECELHYIGELGRTGLAAPVLKTFKNGLIYEYTPGVTLNFLELGKCDFVDPIIDAMVKLHKSGVAAYRGDRSPILFPSIRKYIEMLRIAISDEPYDDEQKLSSVKEQRKTVVRSKVDQVRGMIDRMEALVLSKCSNSGEVVMCHNDLLDTNIIYNRSSKSIRFIDFEYSGYNYASYDVANHLNEYAGMSEHTNFKLIPTRPFITDWCRKYLRACQQDGRNEEVISEAEIEDFVDKVEMFMHLSHLFWSLWAFFTSLLLSENL